MAFRFPYIIRRVPQPVLTLNGRYSRPKPLIPVRILGPSGDRITVGLLDTGADDTIFPASWAPSLGIDLSSAPTGTAAGVGMASSVVRYAQASLRITDGVEVRTWPAWVGFTDTPLRNPLLGFAGFLQFFTATFRGDREGVELEVNSFYSGT